MKVLQHLSDVLRKCITCLCESKGRGQLQVTQGWWVPFLFLTLILTIIKCSKYEISRFLSSVLVVQLNFVSNLVWKQGGRFPEKMTESVLYINTNHHVTFLKCWKPCYIIHKCSPLVLDVVQHEFTSSCCYVKAVNHMNILTSYRQELGFKSQAKEETGKPRDVTRDLWSTTPVDLSLSHGPMERSQIVVLKGYIASP